MYPELAKFEPVYQKKPLKVQCVFRVGPGAPFHMESLALLTTLKVIFDNTSVKQLASYAKQVKDAVAWTFDELEDDKANISVFAT